MEKNKDFYKLFLINEGKSIAGKNYRNLISLCCILFLTFASIGFGEGGLKYLEHKMSDPFINWISVPLDFVDNEKVTSIQSDLNDLKNKTQYQYKNTSLYAHFILYFYDVNNKEVSAESRTIEASSPLLTRLLSDEFKIDGIKDEDKNNYFGENSIGLIVTKDYINKLGYANTPAYLDMTYPIKIGDSSIDFRVPLPVVAVVKQLPGMVSIMTTPFFYNQKFSGEFPFNTSVPQHQNYIRVFIPQKIDANVIKDKYTKVLNDKWPQIVKTVQVENIRESYQTGKALKIDFSDEYVAKDFDIKQINQVLKFENDGVKRIYNFNDFKLNVKDFMPSCISVYFNNLDSIKSFQNYMFQKHELKIDMTQIDAKENFNFMSKLTKITLFILILFCIFSISLFVYNLFRNHLEKIKKNIGTFKAFGLENNALMKVYSTISFALVGLSIALGFGFALFFGNLGGVRFILNIFGVHLESGYLYFDLNTTWSYVTIILLIIVSTGIVWVKLKKVVKNTPGDLIYERK